VVCRPAHFRGLRRPFFAIEEEVPQLAADAVKLYLGAVVSIAILRAIRRPAAIRAFKLIEGRAGAKYIARSITPTALQVPDQAEASAGHDEPDSAGDVLAPFVPVPQFDAVHALVRLASSEWHAVIVAIP
jgi:hypothetical protein